MIKEYMVYFMTFSSRFVFRTIFPKLLQIKEAEVRLLSICEKLASMGSRISRLKQNKIKVSLLVNEVAVDVILRKDTSDLFVLNQVILQNEYAPLYDMISQREDRNEIKVIVDVGANIGVTTLYFSSLFPKASIYAIEPSGRNFEILQENIDVNGIAAFPINKALLASPAKVKLINTFRDKRDWSTRVVRSECENDIEAVAFTDLKLALGLDKIDILKIDIEGHEVELFNSKAFLSELETVKFIAIEIHEEEADRIAIINTLQKHGYTLISKGETLFGYNEAR